MAREDDINIAWSEFNAAHSLLAKCLPGRQGIGANAKYGQAYQRLVMLGERQQIKLKYRRN